MKRRIFLQATPALISMATTVQSQTGYPSKPIRYIVPVATGGGSDMVGRTVTERWAKVLGQSIVVENQGGAGGVIASQNTVRATPDGYTLMQGYVATHGTAPATRKLPYDPVRSFTPIGMIGSTPNVIVVNDKVPATTVGELIDYIRKNPGRTYQWNFLNKRRNFL
jgi:tripartite-type tricarboxylate transporter receptor subunit TctC